MAKQTIKKLLFRAPAKMLETPANRYFPWTLAETLSWSDFLSVRCGVYYQALEKAVSFFVTDLNFQTDISDSERDRGQSTIKHTESVERLFKRRFKVQRDLANIGVEMLNWGSTFCYLHIPFRRMLICTQGKCSARFAYLNHYQDVKYDLNQLCFKGKCPICKKSGNLTVDDVLVGANDMKPVLTSLPPSLIQLDEAPISGKQRISLEASAWPWLKDGIIQNDALFLAEMPENLIKAVAQGGHLMYAEDEIFHGRVPAPANISANLCGWGYPMHLKAHDDVMQLLFIDRMNQAIVHEHGGALRMLAPAPQAATGLDFGGAMGNGVQGRSEFTGISMRGFAGEVSNMLTRWRRNPSLVQFLPYPVQQQIMGGDAKAMVMPELMEYYEKRMLRNLSIPAEFYEPNLSTPGQLFSINSFRQKWRLVPDTYEDLLNWCNHRMTRIQGGRETLITLTTPNIFDSKEAMALKKEMAGSNQLPRESLLAMIGEDEGMVEQKLQRQQLRDQEQAEAMQKLLEERGANQQALAQMGPGMQLAQDQQATQGQPGQPPPGPGAPPAQPGAPSALPPPGPGGQGRPATLDQFAQKANELAQQFATQPTAQLTQSMNNLKATDEQMYNQVAGILKSKNSQAETAGRQAFRTGQIQL